MIQRFSFVYAERQAVVLFMVARFGCWFGSYHVGDRRVRTSLPAAPASLISEWGKLFHPRKELASGVGNPANDSLSVGHLDSNPLA